MLSFALIVDVMFVIKPHHLVHFSILHVLYTRMIIILEMITLLRYIIEKYLLWSCREHKIKQFTFRANFSLYNIDMLCPAQSEVTVTLQVVPVTCLSTLIILECIKPSRGEWVNTTWSASHSNSKSSIILLYFRAQNDGPSITGLTL